MYNSCCHISGAVKSYEKDQAPQDYLHHAACCVACAVKSKKTDAASHLQLGLVLEERYMAEDMFALKKEVRMVTCWFCMQTEDNSY